MARQVLGFVGDEREAADAAHWATLRTTRRMPAAGDRRGDARADTIGADGLVVLAHGSRAMTAGAGDPAALAALLVGAGAVEDGMRVVLATADGDDFAARLAIAIAALGRAVTCTSRAADFAFALRVAPRRATEARPAGAAPRREAQAPV
ncbi:MAG: hypothetical protein ACTHL8_13210 [Burkholderiaceae bacterium]